MISAVRAKISEKLKWNPSSVKGEFNFENISRLDYLDLLEKFKKIYNKELLVKDSESRLFEKNNIEQALNLSSESYKNGDIVTAYKILHDFTESHKEPEFKELSQKYYYEKLGKKIFIGKKRQLSMLLVSDLLMVGVLVSSLLLFASIDMNVKKNFPTPVVSVEKEKSPDVPEIEVQKKAPVTIDAKLSGDILLNVLEKAQERNPKITPQDILAVMADNNFVVLLERNAELDKEFANLDEANKTIGKTGISIQKESVVEAMVYLLNKNITEKGLYSDRKKTDGLSE